MAIREWRSVGNEMNEVLSSESGLAVFIDMLLYKGAMCPKCGFGTRVTSKRWAKCKRCGERVARRELPDIEGNRSRA